jgi:hypothetical protein
MDLLNLEDVLDDAERKTLNLALHGKSFYQAIRTNQNLLGNRTIVVDNQRVYALTKYKNLAVMADELNVTGAITRKWRLLRRNLRSAWKLYDVKADQKQEYNLYHQYQNSQLVTSLKQAYETWWATVSFRAEGTSPLFIGTEPTVINAMDRHNIRLTNPFEQFNVARAMKVDGNWVLQASESGLYQFQLHRWPVELANVSSIDSGLAEYPHSVALKIRGGSVNITQLYPVTTSVVYRQYTSLSDDSVNFDVPLPAGLFLLDAWFTSKTASIIPNVYYVNIQLVPEANGHL